jgi:hypothetical protein
MPVEIRELQINVTVSQQNNAPERTAPPAGSTGGEDEKRNLINQCIEQVMEIFNNKKER